MTTAAAISSQKREDVCVVGQGYVGLTLTVALADKEMHVVACEANAQICRMLEAGQVPFFEPGLAEGLQRHSGRSLTIRPTLPDKLPPTVIVCVGTPAYAQTKEPDLSQLTAAISMIAERMQPDTLVIIRSTVPIGTCRAVILPVLAQHIAEPLLAFCPERTIQGRALEELSSLPQIVGGLNEESVRRARALFEKLTPHVYTVSSIEAAEMIKLICNAHTDLIYGFGNQVALMAEMLGLNAYEMIEMANLNYPRPDLSKPGFVGGSCLTKDPYLLIHSMQDHGYVPPMVAAARTLNESIPRHIAERVLMALRQQGCDLKNARVFVSGFAYKGQPETDDLRGGAAGPILEILQQHVDRVAGHDFVVLPERIGAFGVEPVSFEQGFDQANAVLVLNNHRTYAAQSIHTLAARMRLPRVLFDVWGVFEGQQPQGCVQYMRLGRG